MLESDEPEKSQQDVSGADQAPQKNHKEEPDEAGTDSYIDDPSASTEIKQATESESAPQSLPEEKQQNLTDDESIPAWLRAEFSAESVEDSGGNKKDATNDSELDAAQRTKKADEEISLEIGTSEPDTAEATNDSEELGWLEQIASGDGASLDEPPTMSWDTQPEDARTPEADDDEMAWLEEIDTEESMPVVAETNNDYPNHGESTAQPADDKGADAIPPDDPIGDVPDDPDEVMAWLEKLAARQGADLEELPTYTAGLSASEPVQMDQMPEDPDEAMAWLEQLSALEGSLTDDSTSVVEPDAGDVTDELMAESQLTEILDEEAADSGDAEMSEELNEALIWLEEIVEKPPEKEEAELVTEESAEVITPLQSIAAVEDAEYSDDIESEEVEQAMEWLEQLAARQGAAPEELTSVIDADTDAQIPHWLEAQIADMQPEEPVEEVISAAVDDSETQAELAISDVDESIDRDELVISGGEEISSRGEEVIESLSEVAPEVATELASDEDMAWLETLGSVDAEAWLESEEEATVVSEDSQISHTDSEILISKEFAAEPEQKEFIEFVDDNLQEVEALEGELLDAAHSAINAGDFLQAAEEYAILLEQEVEVDKLILDLESLSESFSHEPVMQRLQGDAYAKNGQTQKALEVYRKALDNL